MWFYYYVFFFSRSITRICAQDMHRPRYCAVGIRDLLSQEVFASKLSLWYLMNIKPDYEQRVVQSICIPRDNLVNKAV